MNRISNLNSVSMETPQWKRPEAFPVSSPPVGGRKGDNVETSLGDTVFWFYKSFLSRLGVESALAQFREQVAV